MTAYLEIELDAGPDGSDIIAALTEIEKILQNGGLLYFVRQARYPASITVIFKDLTDAVNYTALNN